MTLTAAAATATSGTRLFLSNVVDSAIIELTGEGARVRTFEIDGVVGAAAMTVDGSGRLFAVSNEEPPSDIRAITIADVEREGQRQKAWTQLGAVPSAQRGAASMVVINEMLIVTPRVGDGVHFIPLTPPFV